MNAIRIALLACLLSCGLFAAAFEPYACSLGTVTEHQSEPPAYIIRRPDGTVTGILANGATTPANVEADIANPAPAPAAPAYAGPTWTDAGAGHTGLVLAVDADSQAKFTADVTGYQAKLITGDLDLDTDTTVIRDAAGAEHTLTIRQYLRLLGRLHDALRAAWQSTN